MANFDTADDRHNAVHMANSLLPQVRGLYVQAKQVQAALALYQAGSTPAFNAAVNALFSASERTELGQMLSQINALVTDWETNHIGAIGI